MSITFRSTFNGAERARKMQDAAKLALSKELQLSATEIITRTQGGAGVDGSPFDGYSEGYARARTRAGRRASPVDLTFTGQMLQAITSAVQTVGNVLEGRIFFADSESAAKARYNQVDNGRRFFGLSDSQRARLRAAVYEAIGRK